MAVCFAWVGTGDYGAQEVVSENSDATAAQADCSVKEAANSACSSITVAKRDYGAWLRGIAAARGT